MKEIDTGGQAFSSSWARGMTLRDWFAGMAMQGALANPNITIDTLPALSAKAYEIADAMIRQRAKKEEAN